ncbi:UDP-glycosyltransferase UGT5-like [Drosophila tropicalis]|uniref:UDP-glycosyltransferase UGT5-like n=1 Tax=Drosophila tropicalis TaxID=46794 RepID=UPI0035ABE65E
MAAYKGHFLQIALIGAILIASAQSANILGIFTSISPSHLIIQMSTVKVLAENGHNVTVVTTLKPKVTHPKINVIQVPLTPDEDKELTAMLADMTKADNKNLVLNLYRIFGQRNLIFEKMESVMFDQKVKDLYENQDNKFDLVFVGFFMNNYQLGLARKLKAPVVITAPMPPSLMLNVLIGNPSEMTYVPSFTLAVEKGKPMTFTQRLINFASHLAFKTALTLQESRNVKTYKSLYGDDPAMPSYEELKKNVSLVFFASHGISEGPIRPNVPGAIEIGGIQIKDKPDPLPKDMEKFLNDAKQGAILLSLGSNVKGSFLKPEIVQRMFSVLSKLKQNVIWKWEDLENTPGKSPNILYSKWVPQDDILAHPNLKLFITHAGKGGITEAQYHGKPMLSLPIFGDQAGNAGSMVKAGFGVSLDLLTLEEDSFNESLMEVLENPKYAQAVGTFSSLYRDRPLSARESVLYWSEYVIRHRGAPHLQSPSVHMDFIAANNLDVYLLVVIILLISLLVLKVSIKFIYKKLMKKSQKVKRQ